jgi:hypothetical protein
MKIYLWEMPVIWYFSTGKIVVFANSFEEAVALASKSDKWDKEWLESNPPVVLENSCVVAEF